MTTLATIRTLIRYFSSIGRKSLGLRQNKSGAEIDDIFNYVKISDQLSSSGQPTPQQFRSISDAGFAQVINLLPAGGENSLDNEGDLVTDLGMRYDYIPVDFKRPTEEDFALFVAAMEGHESRKVWVHCAVNARVSVFIARYRHEVLGVPEDEARAPIAKVWEPFGVWKGFLKGVNQ